MSRTGARYCPLLRWHGFRLRPSPWFRTYATGHRAHTPAPWVHGSICDISRFRGSDRAQRLAEAPSSLCAKRIGRHSAAATRRALSDPTSATSVSPSNESASAGASATLALLKQRLVGCSHRLKSAAASGRSQQSSSAGGWADQARSVRVTTSRGLRRAGIQVGLGHRCLHMRRNTVVCKPYRLWRHVQLRLLRSPRPPSQLHQMGAMPIMVQWTS